MHDPAWLRLMAEYNRWMNERVYALCAEVSDEERKRDRGAFFRSIHGTLNHLVHADRAWLDRFAERPRRVPALGTILHEGFEDLRRAREELDAELLEWVATVSFEWMEKPFEWQSTVDGKVRVVPAWVLVVHVFNHQAHHRGQLTTLLKQIGIDPGITDLPWLPSLEAGGPPAR